MNVIYEQGRYIITDDNGHRFSLKVGTTLSDELEVFVESLDGGYENVPDYCAWFRLKEGRWGIYSLEPCDPLNKDIEKTPEESAWEIFNVIYTEELKAQFRYEWAVDRAACLQKQSKRLTRVLAHVSRKLLKLEAELDELYKEISGE